MFTNKQKLLEQIRDIEKKTYVYAGNIHYIEEIKFDEGRDRVFIKTNLKTYDRPPGDVIEFLRQFEPVTSVAKIDGNADQTLAMIVDNNSEADSLIAILQDNIKKVQESKDYIPQATAINNNVNSIINIEKMKIGMIKQMQKRSNKSS